MTVKADRLRGRLSINPDEVTPPLPPARLVTQLAPEPAPAPASEPALEPVSSEPEEPATTAPVPPKQPAARRPRAVPQPTDAPLEGRSDYRSFYVSDEAFYRFRAAIYWSSRNPKGAGEVPENMSAAAEQWMIEVATDLERRYNDGEPFPTPPAPRRRRRSQG
jgi:hypothetical protein